MSNAVIKLDTPNPRVAVIERGAQIFAPHIIRLITDIIRRLGGQRSDFVQEARNAAFANRAMLRALTRGITTGYYHTPAEDQILDFTPTSATTATITIAQHTRSTAAATIAAGSVTGVTRGATYYVYYDDAGDAGGTVTFNATTDVSGLTTAGRKTVGAIYVENPSPTGGTEA
jgi:hypothetical protein